MHYPALLALLAASASAILSEPIEPTVPTYVSLPGWPQCRDQCALAVQAPDTTMSTDEEQWCPDGEYQECTYYYCCVTQPVTCDQLAGACWPGTFNTTFWVAPREIKIEPEPER